MRAEKNSLKRLGKALGPGLITGASDDDPSGIGTYSQAGAQHGFATLWMIPAMLPMVTAVQYMCAKIGLVTGKGLAGVLREHYPRALYPAVIALVIANTGMRGRTSAPSRRPSTCSCRSSMESGPPGLARGPHLRPDGQPAERRSSEAVVGSGARVSEVSRKTSSASG